MSDRNKRLIALIIMLISACLYVDSHTQHDIWMTQRLSEQQNQIDFLLKYVIILKRQINEKPNRQHSTYKNK